LGGWVYGMLTPLSTIFQLYRVVSLIGGGNRSTWRKLPTCLKSLAVLTFNGYNLNLAKWKRRVLKKKYDAKIKLKSNKN